VLAICREYAQPPRWFYELEHGERCVLMADWRIRHNVDKQKTTKRGRDFWLTSD
jgi:hypothetical protein|tara:strand:- start:108 stop:269 length:162 start_codon:yes stop_codon:yes gene_type:complete